MRDYLAGQLRTDYLVAEAADGEEGLRKAIRIIPDLIISDIKMPKMDGLELSRRIKTNERTSHIPFIMLTALSGIEDRIEGLETAANDYITKPSCAFTPQHIVSFFGDFIRCQCGTSMIGSRRLRNLPEVLKTIRSDEWIFNTFFILRIYWMAGNQVEIHFP